LLLQAGPALTQEPNSWEPGHYDTQLAFSTGYLGIALVSAHLAAPVSYDPRRDTISHLGSQHYENAWIMNAGFVGFGGAVASSAIAYSIRTGEDWPTTLGLSTWGIGILASGFWSLSPFLEDVAYDQTESNHHQVFATTAGIGISAASFSLLLSDPDPRRKFVHGAALIFMSGTSAMVGLMPDSTGVWQRVLWAGSLAWLNWTMLTDTRYSR